MVGQNKLIDKLNKYTIDTLPKSILLLGSRGSGKHTIINDLAKRLNLEVINITYKANDTAELKQQLLDYKVCPVNKLYLIDIDGFDANNQQKFLTFVEEPSMHMYVVIISESERNVISTILNRCITFKMEEYTIDQLKQVKLFNNEEIYSVCNTPGQVQLIDDTKFEQAYYFAKQLVEWVINANWSYVLGVANNLNYKDNYDKVDCYLFLRLISYISFKDYIENNNKISYIIYRFARDHELLSSYNAEWFVTNYIVQLKQVVIKYGN